MKFYPKHTEQEYTDLVYRHGIANVGIGDEKRKIFDVIFDLEEQIALLSAACRIVLECENDRLSAKHSGLETGWEHPGTQTHFKKVVIHAKKALEQEGEH